MIRPYSHLGAVILASPHLPPFLVKLPASQLYRVAGSQALESDCSHDCCVTSGKLTSLCLDIVVCQMGTLSSSSILGLLGELSGFTGEFEGLICYPDLFPRRMESWGSEGLNHRISWPYHAEVRIGAGSPVPWCHTMWTRPGHSSHALHFLCPFFPAEQGQNISWLPPVWLP